MLRSGNQKNGLETGAEEFVSPPKEGNLKECVNHCTINLIVHARKLLLNIMREEITNIRVIMDKYKECNIPLSLWFIDYSKAFDYVNHNLLWMDMQGMGFPQRVIELLAHLYRDQMAMFRTPCGESEFFSISCGVRHGCILSPTLFNISTEDIIREATENPEKESKSQEERSKT